MITRPHLFTPQQLQSKVDNYFNEIENSFVYRYDVVKTGQDAGKELKIKIPVTPSKIGIVDFLNIDRATWFNWGNDTEKDKEIFNIVTRANQKIETIQQKMVNAGLANPMIIARLQGLSDKVETTSATIDTTNKSEDEIRIAIQAIEQARKAK